MNARPVAREPREVLSSSFSAICASGNSTSSRARVLRVRRRPASITPATAQLAKLCSRVAKNLNRRGKRTTGVSKEDPDIGLELFPWKAVIATARDW